MFGPRPRFRFYGVPRNYFIALHAYLTGRVAKGDDVQQLERSLESRLEIEHAIAVSQARVGIHLVMKHLLGASREVILSPYTIYDVVNMVIAAGAKPVFCDIDPETCNIDLEKAKTLVTERTAAILITHLHGLTADAVAFRRFCDERGLYLIEDAAQAFGARVDDRYAGTIGHAGVYSFGRVKNVNGFFGGAVVTHDARLAARIRAEVASWPQMEPAALLKRIVNCLIADVATMPIVFQLLTFWIFRYGCLHDVKSVNKIVDTEDHPVRRERLPERYLRAITPLQARMVSSQLDTVEANNQARIERAMEYADGLARLGFVQLPPPRTDGSHIYMAYPVQVADRWDFVKHMMRHGCDLTIQHYNNTADLECFRDVARDCPVARRVSRCVVLLPTYPGFGSRQVRRMLAAAEKYQAAPELAQAERPVPPQLS
jgi:dTDP-4-amino-4,6-dideoxygalactose transaminase